MAKQFIKGKTYVFTTKKFKKDFPNGKVINGSWITKCNGNKVAYETPESSHIGFYSILPRWCKCIDK